jgi:hypothetical protein
MGVLCVSGSVEHNYNLRHRPTFIFTKEKKEAEEEEARF